MEKSNYSIPIVLEGSPGRERSWDLYSRLLQDNIICLTTEIDDHVAGLIVGQLLFLNSKNPDEPIKFYINSPGGLVTAGLAIYDTMQNISNPISTICIGQAASMATVLLAGGSKGRRKALPNARLMTHQLSGGSYGQGTDIEIAAKEMMRMKRQLTQILSEHSGRPYEEVLTDMERDKWFTPIEALSYGLIDTIIKPKK